MRKWVIESLMEFADDPNFVFLTGDLGFNFLEPLAAKMGDRFINAGVAEQNMVSVAAGLARQGMRVFCYSISPFLYARAFEQIRVDIVLNQLPVQMIGSGAGFDYGSMGPEHHALEDYGTLLTLNPMNVFTPWCEASLKNSLLRMKQSRTSSYMRLDRSGMDIPLSMQEVRDWYRLMPAKNSKEVYLCIGSSVKAVYEHLSKQVSHPELWVLGKLPFEEPPAEFLSSVDGQKLTVIEEHVSHGGVGEKICAHFYNKTEKPAFIERKSVQHVFTGLFGDRNFHLGQNDLLPEQIYRQVNP